MSSHFLNCGCRTCGCVCTSHSPSGERLTCASHTVYSVSQAVAYEAVRLVAIGFFVSIVLIWAAIFCA